MEKLLELLDWLGVQTRGVVFERMLTAAAYLVSEGGENSEYDRGIYELIADVCGQEIPAAHMDEARDYVMHAIALIKAERRVAS